MDKPVPVIQNPGDAIVRVTLGSICTSDLHILHGSVPYADQGLTLIQEGVTDEQALFTGFPVLPCGTGAESYRYVC